MKLIQDFFLLPAILGAVVFIGMFLIDFARKQRVSAQFDSVSPDAEPPVGVRTKLAEWFSWFHFVLYLQAAGGVFILVFGFKWVQFIWSV